MLSSFSCLQISAGQSGVMGLPEGKGNLSQCQTQQSLPGSTSHSWSSDPWVLGNTRGGMCGAWGTLGGISR